MSNPYYGGVAMVLTPETLEIFSPRGQKFLIPVELDSLREQKRQGAEVERQKYQDLLKQLQAKGIDKQL